MTDGPTRRRYLAVAGVGLAAATAGCLGSLDPFGGDDGMRVRARTATGTETDVKCHLSSQFVAAHPPLKRVFAAADGDEWASRHVGLDAGESLGSDLQDHCDGETRGLYEYEGQWYFVSLRYENPKDHEEGHHHAGGTATPHDH
ncbi:MAG: hypothetical protein ABEJ82_04405 [Haloplanus sp.]